MANMRGFLYCPVPLLGDLSAVRKGRGGRRVGRPVTGRTTGRLLRKLWK